VLKLVVVSQGNGYFYVIYSIVGYLNLLSTGLFVLWSVLCTTLYFYVDCK